MHRPVIFLPRKGRGGDSVGLLVGVLFLGLAEPAEHGLRRLPHGGVPGLRGPAQDGLLPERVRM